MSIQQIQLEQLNNLLHKAAGTEIGRRHNFDKIQKYDQFRSRVPIHRYDDIKQDVEKLKRGKQDVFWPGDIHKFSVSAGTTGSGKHLPLTEDRLKSDRRYLRKIAFSYFKQRPSFTSLLGRQISLPGTLEKTHINGRSIQLGEISGFLGAETPAILRLLQLVPPEELLGMSFSEKFEKIVSASLNADIRVITAVPSWILTLFQHVLERSGKQSIAEIWPNLKLLICGGVKLANYKPHLNSLTRGLNLDFIETYGASEGYFSYSDPLGQEDMKLVVDNNIFYEWLPHSEQKPMHQQSDKLLPTWQVEKNVPYAMMVSTNAGLWRYPVNDLIEFTSIDPPRIKVKGRVQDVLDHFGEAVYGWEAENALEQSCEELGVSFNIFSVGSLLRNEKELPRHHWFIECRNPPSLSRTACDELAVVVDQNLQSINRHYAIRRESEALGEPVIHLISPADIKKWMKQRGKLGAQSKMPRILHSREEVEIFLNIIGQ